MAPQLLGVRDAAGEKDKRWKWKTIVSCHVIKMQKYLMSRFALGRGMFCQDWQKRGLVKLVLRAKMRQDVPNARSGKRRRVGELQLVFIVGECGWEESAGIVFFVGGMGAFWRGAET